MLDLNKPPAKIDTEITLEDEEILKYFWEKLKEVSIIPRNVFDNTSNEEQK